MRLRGRARHPQVDVSSFHVPVPHFLSVLAPQLTSVFPILHLLLFFLCTFLC